MSDSDNLAEVIPLRMDDEEQELRRIAPGDNHDDYHHMYALFVDVVQHALGMSTDPNAFRDSRGDYNALTINAYRGLLSTAAKTLESLNKMRNADKMTEYLVEQSTRDLVGAASIEIGFELKKILDMLDSGASDGELGIAIKQLMFRKLPSIFAQASVSATRSE